MDDKKEKPPEEYVSLYGYYPSSNELCLDAQLTEEIKIPVKKTEAELLYEFFRGHSLEVSQILKDGYCAQCFKIGLKIEWHLVGIGYKSCPRCGWQDY